MRRLRFGRIIWVTATTLVAGGLVACSGGVDKVGLSGVGGSSGSGPNGGWSGNGTGGSTANGGSANGGSANGGSSNGGSSNGGTSNGGSGNGGSTSNGGTTGDEPDAGFEPDSGTDPAPDAGPTFTNLVANFDAEALTIAPWIAGQAGTVAIATDQFHSGSQSVVTVGRNMVWQGVGVNLTDVVEYGKVYDASVFVRTSAASTAEARFSARATCDGIDKYKTIKQLPVSETSWTELSGTLTMWTEADCTPMANVQLFVEQVDATLQIYADDMVVMEQVP